MGGLRPAEWLWVDGVGLDEGPDVILQLLDGGVEPASYLFVGEQGEEVFDLIDPG